MKPYLLSLAAGLLVGVIYSLLNIRSPAPPLIALIGLLGILIGEQLIPVSRGLLAGSTFVNACEQSRTVDHLFGMLPGRHGAPRPTETRSTETAS